MKNAYEIADQLRTRIQEAQAATAHLRDYKPDYIDVRVVASPGEPDIYHETGCTAVEMLALIDKATADRLTLQEPAEIARHEHNELIIEALRRQIADCHKLLDALRVDKNSQEGLPFSLQHRIGMLNDQRNQKLRNAGGRRL